MEPPRTIAVWCPDWPVAAACIDNMASLPGAADAAGPAATIAELPVAVVTANRVVASSHAARSAGVLRGLRRREAQARCPELVVLARNEAAEARLFEPVVAALESIAPGVEITRPGLAAIGARGPTRYFGGEPGVLHALSRALANRPAPASRNTGAASRPAARRAHRHRRRHVRRRAGCSPRPDRRPLRLARVPGTDADRDARPVPARPR